MGCRVSRVAGAFALALSSAPPLAALQQDSAGAHTVITVDSLDRAAFSNVAELLQARVPGLHIARTGDGGMRWFMRGPASASESGPMVLLDDVRIDMSGSATRELGTRPPLLDEIDPEDVERIEIWRGPASAFQQGSGSGNGVLRIVTFAPRAQRTSFRMRASAGMLDEHVTYPPNAIRAGVDTAGRPVSACTVQMEATGFCTPTGPPTVVNVLESQSPFERGIAARAAAALASGNDRLAWRGGASIDREGSTSGTLAAQRIHLRGAAMFRPGEALDATLRAHWGRGTADLPAFNQPSLLQQGLFARADTAWPGFVRPPESPYSSARYGVAMNGGWRLGSWIDARLTSGIERATDENDLEYMLTPFGTEQRRYDSRGERRRRDLTVRLDAEARYGGASLRHATTLTAERVVSRQEEEFRESIRTDGGAFSSRAFWINQRTGIAGLGVRHQLHVASAMSLAAGLRIDQVRLGDVRWDVPVSPHVAATWTVRPFVPNALGGVRLRAALGDAANVPQTTRLVFYSGSGQPERPKAEVTRERELGLDAAVAHDRIDLSVTGYTKRTSNVVNVVANAFPGPVMVHRIEVLNRGIETSLHARLVQTARTTWDVRVSYAHNHNEVTHGDGQSFVDLGSSISGFQRQWVMPGRSLGAHRSFPIKSVRDLDGDGLVDTTCVEPSSCEVIVGSMAQYRPAYPPTSASVETSFRFGAVGLSVLIDHRSGHAMYNLTRWRRCFFQCLALYDPSASLRDQAEAMLASGGSGAAVEDASFTKLREISLRIDAPASLARALGGSRLRFSVAGRNLATWTDYSGLDPEPTSFAWIPLASIDNAAMPLPRRFVARLDLEGR